MPLATVRFLVLVGLVVALGCSGCAGPGAEKPLLTANEPEVHATEGVPRPKMALTVLLGDDGRSWEVRKVNAEPTKIVTEVLLPGETMDHWTERVSQHIIFTRKDMPSVVSTLVERVQTADPSAKLGATKAPDGSITLQYNSPAANEAAILRFFQGPDGVYMVGYFARPTLPNIADLFGRWHAILEKSRLLPNPAGKP